MRRSISLFLSLLLILALTVPAKTVQSQENLQADPAQAAYVEGDVLVTLAAPKKTGLAKEGTSSFDDEITVENAWSFGDAKSTADTPAEKKELEDKTLYISQVHSDSYSTEELVEELQDQANVLSVEPNYYRHKLAANEDTYRNQQWYLDGTGAYQATSSGIHYEETKKLPKQEQPIVAVVDTGIDYTHEDLAEHMWVNPFPASSLAGTYGYDFGDNDSNPMDEDEDGHGTHCAGVISAVSGNETGISGISDAKLMALKVFDSEGDAKDSSIIAAFHYIYKAQSLGVNIAAINCSWGGGGSTPASIRSLIEQIGARGGLFLFAAGNDGINHDYIGKNTCPYDLDSNYVVTVGASDRNDRKAGFSDYGKKTVDLFAPGESIFSTVNTGVFSPAIFTEEQRNQWCEFYTSLDQSTDIFYTAPDIGRPSRTIYYHGKSYAKEDAYGRSDSGSLCLSITPLRNTATLELYLDVTELGLNQFQTYYLSYDLGIPENGIVSWDHYMVKSTTDHFMTMDGKTYLRLVSLTGNFRSLSRLYFDNPGISTANLRLSRFPKYNALSGTSMAAPQAAAAAALLAGVYPNDNAAERRNRLLNCVRETETLSSYCITGGILDLGKIPTASKDRPTEETKTGTITNQENKTSTKKILVKKVKLNKKKAVLRYGKKLKLKAAVTPKKATNKKVKWYVSNKKYAKVTQKGVVRAKKKGIGHTVKVYAKAKDKSGKKAYCKVRLKKKKK